MADKAIVRTPVMVAAPAMAMLEVVDMPPLAMVKVTVLEHLMLHQLLKRARTGLSMVPMEVAPKAIRYVCHSLHRC